MADVQLVSIAGNTGRKQVIRGTISIATPNLSNTATISSVVTANCKVSFLGGTHTSNTSCAGRVELTNSTTVTAYVGTNSSGSATVGYEITEYY